MSEALTNITLERLGKEYAKVLEERDAIQAKLDIAVKAMKITKMCILEKYPITGHSMLKNINNALVKIEKTK